LREGKEPAQGVAILTTARWLWEAEEGRAFVGGELQVIVTSALQTSAGSHDLRSTQSIGAMA
jgi:uncharacterized protein YacL